MSCDHLSKIFCGSQTLFQRLEVTKQQLIDMFKHNPFKQRLIEEKNIGDTTVYRCGSLIDMCRGPHLPHTGKAKAVK